MAAGNYIVLLYSWPYIARLSLNFCWPSPGFLYKMWCLTDHRM